jgi:hypothetical protein
MTRMAQLAPRDGRGCQLDIRPPRRVELRRSAHALMLFRSVCRIQLFEQATQCRSFLELRRLLSDQVLPHLPQFPEQARRVVGTLQGLAQLGRLFYRDLTDDFSTARAFQALDGTVEGSKSSFAGFERGLDLRNIMGESRRRGGPTLNIPLDAQVHEDRNGGRDHRGGRECVPRIHRHAPLAARMTFGRGNAFGVRQGSVGISDDSQGWSAAHCNPPSDDFLDAHQADIAQLIVVELIEPPERLFLLAGSEHMPPRGGEWLKQASQHGGKRAGNCRQSRQAIEVASQARRFGADMGDLCHGVLSELFELGR